MHLRLVFLCFLLTFLTVQAGKKSSRHKSKSERKRNTDYNPVSGPSSYAASATNYNAATVQVPAQEAPAAAASYPGNYAGIALRHNYNQPLPPPQNPPVLDALDILRGRPPLASKEASDVIAYASGGKDFPAYLEIPKTYFSCASVKPGLYADLDHYCQVYHRCDAGGKQSTYLCPPKTLFNQITLVCDWFYNVNCPNSRQFVDYSNSRLYYPQWHVLDTQLDYVQPYVQPRSDTVTVLQVQPPPVLYPGKPTNQLYNANIHGHENPEYQMSVVIRNPQLVPDYSVGESQLVPKNEQMDQGSTLAPPQSASPQVNIHVSGSSANENPNNPPVSASSEQTDLSVSEAALQQRPALQPQHSGSVNVTINLGHVEAPVASASAASHQQSVRDALSHLPTHNQRFTS